MQSISGLGSILRSVGGQKPGNRPFWRVVFFSGLDATKRSVGSDLNGLIQEFSSDLSAKV